ncbi:MAG: DUF4255 domain-containing protein [Anaerolineae bacterium]|nr:DUF4255 domain-containing protein [Anaerolineae bacterium]
METKIITDLDRTIYELLLAELPYKRGQVHIAFEQPTRGWSAKLTKPTADFFLYDVRENNTLRQHQWEHINGSAMDKVAGRKRSPFRMDFAYMLTTWSPSDDAGSYETEHDLLSDCILTLLRYPVLPDDRLMGKLQDPSYPIQTCVSRNDRLTNPAEVWASLDNEMRPSISYIVTLALDPWTKEAGITEAPTIRTLTLRDGPTDTLPRRRQLIPDRTRTDMTFIGGTVWTKGENDTPQALAGVQVTLKGTGLRAITDDEGRFVLGSLVPGEYELLVRTADGKVKGKSISVTAFPDPFDLAAYEPTHDGDYDVVM